MSFRSSLLVAFLLFTACYALGDGINITLGAADPNAVPISIATLPVAGFVPSNGSYTFQDNTGYAWSAMEITGDGSALSCDLTSGAVFTACSFDAGTGTITFEGGGILNNGETFALSFSGLAGGSLTSFTIADCAVVAVPEPSGMLLLGTGLVGLAGTIRRKLKR